MSETIVRDIPLDAISPWEGNRAIGRFDEEKLQELAKSIAETGVHQPAIVRQVDGTEAYQLVAGERRWRASRIAGQETLPCIVRELTDIEVLRIQIIENVQREDVHPLDEADGYARLLQTAEYSVEDLAGKVGRSKSYVHQRLKLRDLVDVGRERFVSGELGTAAAIAIARLPIPAQKLILKQLQGYLRETDIDDWVKRNIFHDLRKVAFKLDDAELVEKAGPCTTCPKRTGASPELFPEITDASDTCLDAACLKGKQKALIERQKALLSDQKAKFITMTATDDYSYVKGAENHYNYEPAKKKDPEAIPAIIVSGPGSGRIEYVKKRTYEGNYVPAKETPAQRRKRLDDQVGWETKRALPEALARAIVDRIDTAAGDNAEFPQGLFVDLLASIAEEGDERVAAACGLDPRAIEGTEGSPFDAIRARFAGASRREIDLTLIRYMMDLLICLADDRWHDGQSSAQARLDQLVAETGVDPDQVKARLEERIRAEITAPKSKRGKDKAEA